MEKLTFLILLTLFISCNYKPNGNIKNNTVDLATTKKNDKLNKPSTCGKIIMEILTTSPRYEELTNGLEERIVKNGGISYGINFEGSPNPTQDDAFEYSKTYDFSLHETYPTHNPVIARFTFDNKAKQLYEYNVAEDTLLPIMFNKKLLSKLNTACK